MREIETKLRSGMTANGILGETQDRIVQSITSFALYGFPESHAASFALIAYASAYLKCHYLAAFTAAMLNNQPMGFYHPATLVKDAQRHGLHFQPVDVQQSSWKCTIEDDTVRLGLNYVRGVRKETAEAIVAARPFSSIDGSGTPRPRHAQTRAADAGGSRRTEFLGRPSSRCAVGSRACATSSRSSL